MKKMKMFTGLLASLVFLASCANSLLEGTDSVTSSASDRSAVWSGSPVRLLYAQPFLYSSLGSSWDQVNFFAHVKDIGTPASRVVSIHYNAGTTWNTLSMTKVADYGDHSLYSVTLQGSRKEFVVKFESDAGTYWDNNGGANYKVKPYDGIVDAFKFGVVGGNVGLNKATALHHWAQIGTTYQEFAGLDVLINVENLSPNKSVGIRYTIDGGISWHDASGAWSFSNGTGGAKDLETWKVELRYLPKTASSITFAVFYKNLDNVTESWDNNFTQNYHQSMTPGTVLQ